MLSAAPLWLNKRPNGVKLALNRMVRTPRAARKIRDGLDDRKKKIGEQDPLPGVLPDDEVLVWHIRGILRTANIETISVKELRTQLELRMGCAIGSLDAHNGRVRNLACSEVRRIQGACEGVKRDIAAGMAAFQGAVTRAVLEMKGMRTSIGDCSEHSAFDEDEEEEAEDADDYSDLSGKEFERPRAAGRREGSTTLNACRSQVMRR